MGPLDKSYESRCNMTPEQKLQILEDFLNSLAHVDDGNVAVLLRSNQEAAAALRRISPLRKIKMVLEFDINMPDYVDGVSDAHHVVVQELKKYIDDEIWLGPAIQSIDISTP
jgi:hypothetical protein